jgi:DNA-directed RNA polymerase subunit beta
LPVSNEDLFGQYIAEDLINAQDRRIFAEAGDEIDEKLLNKLKLDAGFDELPILDIDHVTPAPISATRLPSTRTSPRGRAVRHLSRDASRRAADGRNRRSDVPVAVLRSASATTSRPSAASR